MNFISRDYSPDDLADILAGMQAVLDTTWELSWLRAEEAEMVAFLIHVLRTEPRLLTESFAFKVAGICGLVSSQAEAAVIELLKMHGEPAGNSILEDLAIIEVIFRRY